MNTLEARRRLLGRNVYKRTTEGNPAIAQGSLARMYPGITMQGWTEQAQYEGKNLFSIDDFDSNNKATIQNGTILFNQSLGTVAYNLNLGPGAYSISIARDGYSGINIKINEVAVINNGGGNNYTSNFDVSDGDSVVLEFSEGQNPNGEDRIIYDIMLNSGSTALPYEPYTGRQPSPNPDYPQPITSAGKYNEETRKYEYEVKLTGGNLFNPDGEIVDGLPYDGIPLNNKGIVSMALYEKNQDVDVSNIYFGMCSDKFNSNEVGWAIANGAIQTGGKIIAPRDNRYVCWYPGNDTVLQKVLSRYDVMVNYGDGVYLPYEPYKEQTVLITSDRPLTKWDKLEKRNGQWGWVYKSGNYTVTGEEEYISSIQYIGKTTSNAYFLNAELTDTTTNRNDGYCNALQRYPALWVIDGITGFSFNGHQTHIRISNSDTGVLEDDNTSNVANKIKTYVAQQYQEGNPFIFWYETAEETFVPLTAEEHEQMNELYTFRPTTVLSNDCKCEMTLTYKTKKSLEVTT